MYAVSAFEILLMDFNELPTPQKKTYACLFLYNFTNFWNIAWYILRLANDSLQFACFTIRRPQYS